MCNNIYKVNILPQVKKKKQQTFNQKTQTTTEIIKLYLFLLFSFFFLLFSFFAKKNFENNQIRIPKNLYTNLAIGLRSIETKAFN